MSTKRVLKKGVREKLCIIILVIIAFFIVINLFKHYTSTNYKLAKLGYNSEEIKKIIELKKEDILLKINLSYHEKNVDFLSTKYFIENNFARYIDYYNLHNDYSLDDIVSIINIGADKEFYTNIKDADTSKGNAILVNKFYKLPDNYAPDNIKKIKNWYAQEGQSATDELYDAYINMFKDAEKEGLKIIINNSYRSIEEQRKTWERLGDEYAARPGFSEHNTGLAVDIIAPDVTGDDFDKTEEFKWLINNSYKYGFILRYPKDKENITGYEYESWHFRYLGPELATNVYNSGLTYDEYYAYYIENN